MSAQKAKTRIKSVRFINAPQSRLSVRAMDVKKIETCMFDDILPGVSIMLPNGTTFFVPVQNITEIVEDKD